MRYIHVAWNHSNPEEPVDLYSELDDQRREVRKVEVFRGGNLGYASSTEASGSTRLGEVPIPPLTEIAEESEFRPEEISRAEFEHLWKSARSLLQPR